MALVASPNAHSFLDSPEQSFARSDTAPEREDLWGEMRRILIDVGTQLSADEELENLAAAEAAVNLRDLDRTKIVNQLNGEVKQMKKQLAAAHASAQRPQTVPSPSEHNNLMRQLEEQQYATGKALSEEQAGLAKKEIELGRCKGEKEEVGGWTVGEEEGYGSEVLRLKLINDIGFKLMPSSGTDNASTRILIRNDAKDDVHTTTLDKTRSKSHWANLMWNLASE